MTRTTLYFFVALTLAAAGAHATTHLVRPDGTGDFPTIQDAVNAALPLDTICLDTGVFTGSGNTNIDPAGKNLVFTSKEGPDSSIIDCEGDGRGFHLHTGEGPGTIIERIQVRNGDTRTSSSTGGAMLLEGASPTIRDNIFFYNFADSGGAVYVVDSSADFIRNDFQYNDCVSQCGTEPVPVPPPPVAPDPVTSPWDGQACGGAVFARASDLRFIGNRFYKNMTLNTMMASGIFAVQSNLVVIGNELTGNGWLYSYGGGLTLDRCTATVLGNRMGNSATTGAGILARASTAEVRGNDFSHGFGYIDAGGLRTEAGSSFDISYNFFNDHWGGAISFNGSSGDVTRNILARARNADMSIGVGVQLFNSTATIRQNTFYHNGSAGSTTAGEDIHLRNSGATIQRNVIVSWSQADPIGCYGSAAQTPAGTAADLDPNDWQLLHNVPLPDPWFDPIYDYFCGPMRGFLLDPLLCDPDNGNYFPSEGSPCEAEVLPLDIPNNGELFGALPISCNLEDVLSVYAPPGGVVPAPVAGELYELGEAWLTNTSNVPTTIVYRVEVDGPYELSDNGDPTALVGVTPVLNPGDGWTPPNVAIVTPDIDGAEHVFVRYYASYAPALTMELSATTIVTFGAPLAIGLAGFEARESAGGIELTWETSDVLSPDGWRVYRSSESGPELLTPTPLAPATRSYRDLSVVPEHEYTYTLASIEGDEEFRLRDVSVRSAAAALSLSQNTPNPFNPATSISFSLDRVRNVRLVVYTIEGKEVTTLVDRSLGAGTHSVSWSGTDDRGEPVASGVYFYHLRAGSKNLVRKMVLLK